MLNLTFLGGKKPSQCSGKRSNKGEMDEATSTNNKANESNTSRSYYGTTNSECQNMVNRALQKSEFSNGVKYETEESLCSECCFFFLLLLLLYFTGINDRTCDFQHFFSDSFVKYVINAMETAGCSIPKNFFRVEDCEMAVGGGFMPEEGVCSGGTIYLFLECDFSKSFHKVVVCSNHVMYQEEVDTILIHELIHAYDHCRAANLDWGDCKHHACSEVTYSFQLTVLWGQIV